MAKNKHLNGKPGEPGWEPAPGVKLRMTLRGHTGWIGRISWSPDGKLLASPSADGTIRIWEGDTGEILQTLEGHTGPVWTVAWSPEKTPGRRKLASIGKDKTVRLWNADSGKILPGFECAYEAISLAWSPDGRTLAFGLNVIELYDAEARQRLQTLKGHTSTITQLAWSPDGQRLASASLNGSLRLWDPSTDKAPPTLEGHIDAIYSLAWSPDERRLLASAAVDSSIRIWDPESGKATHSLEAHTGSVTSAAFSPDACWLASRGDGIVRLWRSDTWRTVAEIPEPKSTYWPPGLAFRPYGSVLATVGADPGTSKDKSSQLIHVWDLDYALLSSANHDKAIATVSHDLENQFSTAKIVLVGDSGVGKTGLGWRLAHGEFKEHSSTHGQQFWVIDRMTHQRKKDGVNCEAVLWDLAGQPDYRLIHALHVADADLAVILFDPTHSRDPLGSVKYWLGQLPKDCPKILVPARIDRGSPTLTSEELTTFCEQHGIGGGFVETSASKGIGLDELVERMKAEIPWDRKTATTTTTTFKRIKDFVLGLKEEHEGKRILVTSLELRSMLEQEGGEFEFSDAEMITAVKRVASHGYVRLLKASDGDLRILLVPELLNNLAASFVLEARRNPKGLGAVEEQKILDGAYKFDELDGLEEEDRELLIEATVAAFVENRLSYRCFREQAGEKQLLVFPELINLKKPGGDEGTMVDDLSYSVSGATENTYAGLVVTLGYTNNFTRSNQWHNQARYEYEPGLICGFRRQDEDNGETSYTLYYSEGVGASVKSLFQGLFETTLARKPDLVEVRRFTQVICNDCGMLLDRGVMRERLAQSKEFAFCAECGEKLVLPSAEEPLALTQAVVEAWATVDRRTVFEELVYHLKSRAHSEKLTPKRCFVSYAWDSKMSDWLNPKIEPWALRFAGDLQNAGHDVVLDQTHADRLSVDIARFVGVIEECEIVFVLGTPLYFNKFQNSDKEKGTIVAAEMDLINRRLTGPESEKESVVGLLLDGDKDTSLPPLLRGRTFIDFKNESNYFSVMFDLMLGLYGLSKSLPGISEWREKLRR